MSLIWIWTLRLFAPSRWHDVPLTINRQWLIALHDEQVVQCARSTLESTLQGR